MAVENTHPPLSMELDRGSVQKGNGLPEPTCQGSIVLGGRVALFVIHPCFPRLHAILTEKCGHAVLFFRPLADKTKFSLDSGPPTTFFFAAMFFVPCLRLPHFCGLIFETKSGTPKFDAFPGRLKRSESALAIHARLVSELLLLVAPRLQLVQGVRRGLRRGNVTSTGRCLAIAKPGSLGKIVHGLSNSPTKKKTLVGSLNCLRTVARGCHPTTKQTKNTCWIPKLS